MNGMNFTEARGDNSTPRKRRTIRVQHVSSPSRKPFVITPHSTYYHKVLSGLATLGGTFVMPSGDGRPAMPPKGEEFLEDFREDEEAVNREDPLVPKSFSALEAEASEGDYEDEIIARLDAEKGKGDIAARCKTQGLALCFLSAGNIPPDRIWEAAQTAVENPEVILAFYRAGMQVEGVERGKHAARMQIFSFLQKMVSAMLEIETPEALNRSLALYIDDDGIRVVDHKPDPRSERTLLARLTYWARNEARNNGYGHWTACRILKALGHADVFARYLD